uniref:Reverse transcriptase Ty1/copia-type domain-containing protein n=1 Tax=Solanum lycopersicum TaxID=4081 RepID=A0A3Q7IYR4_SOLLC
MVFHLTMLLNRVKSGVSYSVNKLSQFMYAPSQAHWKTVKHLLRYFKDTAYYGFRIAPSTNLDLSVYSDADWAGNVTDRSSTTGYLVGHQKNNIPLLSHLLKQSIRLLLVPLMRPLGFSFHHQMDSLIESVI